MARVSSVIAALLVVVGLSTNQVGAVKQLGSVCNPSSLISECGRFARCFEIQKQCGSANKGICLCRESYGQRIPPLVAAQALLITSNYSTAGPLEPWTDCYPIAQIGDSCTIDSRGAMTFDLQGPLIMPVGAYCDVKMAQVKCNSKTVNYNGKCVDTLGKRSFGDRCEESVMSSASCNPSKMLACMPAKPYRRCRCSPGFAWKQDDNTGEHICTLIGIGEWCTKNFECNVAQYRAYHQLPGSGRYSSDTSIAWCNSGTNKCQCDESSGFLPASIVVPNVQITVRKRHQAEDGISWEKTESLLMRVQFVRYRSSRRTPFQTDTRCMSTSVISKVSICGGECSLDLDSASASNKIAICAEGLTCHYCPLDRRSQCVQVSLSEHLAPNKKPDNELHLNITNEDLVNIDFCDTIFSARPPFLWMSIAIIALVGSLFVSCVTYLVIRKVRRVRHCRHLAEQVQEAKSASLALLDASSSQVPQVWATFRITPWRT